jgi:branched-chain amino acid aminotransferase
MNVFMYLKNKQGGTELVTPPLNGLILPGVTRQSILDLGRTYVKLDSFNLNNSLFFFRKI